MPLIELCGKYASTTVRKVMNSGFAQMTPLHKWRRKDGLATFLRDMIDLRKTLGLCHTCEQRMPSRWLALHNYELVRGYHAGDSACDWCRNLTDTNLYVPGDGAYFQAYDRAKRSVAATRTRERAAFESDWRSVPPGL